MSIHVGVVLLTRRLGNVFILKFCFSGPSCFSALLVFGPSCFRPFLFLHLGLFSAYAGSQAATCSARSIVLLLASL